MTLKNISNQGGANIVSVLLSSRKLVGLKAAFLKNYLAVSSWILNGSSTECHEKKHQPFSLNCFRYSEKQIGFSHGNLLSNSLPAKTGLSTRNRIFSSTSIPL